MVRPILPTEREAARPRAVDYLALATEIGQDAYQTVLQAGLAEEVAARCQEIAHQAILYSDWPECVATA